MSVRTLIQAAAILALAAMPLPAAAQAEELVIGVRSDAAPFSYDTRAPRSGHAPLTGTPREAGFRGYVADICSDVLDGLRSTRGDVTFRLEPVNAQDRFPRLRDGGIDILCDPATITGERIEGLMLSMPIYLSAVTYAAPMDFPATDVCEHTVGVVSETTAEANGIQQILESGNWARFASAISAALNQGNDQSPGAQAAAGCDAKPIKLYGTHIELAEAFCSDQVLYYVGDIEIVRQKLQSIDACFRKSAIAPATFTDERYAIYGRADPDPGKGGLILAFYAELARQVYRPDSVLLSSYAENFPGFRASDKLKAFYWSLIGRFPE